MCGNVGKGEIKPSRNDDLGGIAILARAHKAGVVDCPAHNLAESKYTATSQ